LGCVCAQRLRGHLHCGLHAGHRWIFTDKPNLVHAYAGVAFQGGTQLLGECARSGRRASRTRGKGTDETGQAGLRTLLVEHDAGNARCGEQPRKALFCSCRFQRHPVQMELVAVGSKQQASSALSVQHRPQFIPGDLKLGGSSRVAKFIQPCKLQQNIQTADKGAGCGSFDVRAHASLAIPTETCRSGYVNAIVAATQSQPLSPVAY
jgi:hypothetical protein